VGGGLLVELDWRLIFWVNIPLIIATVILAHRVISESVDPEAVRGIDGIGIGLSALGLAGPVFALIEQPMRGFSDPLVWGPLIGGIVLFVGFVVWEGRARAPMLPLELFRSHNFSFVNLSTLFVYAALGGAFFFITLFLQQVAGYTAFQAGAATTPPTILMFLLSGRFGALASRIGPRLVMGIGPLIGATGLALLVRVNSDVNYVVDVLPAMLLFGFGLSMTVAPLTTTVLDSVEERHVGVASGVNNAVARVAGVLAIAALGAAISAQFSSSLDDRVAAQSPSPQAQSAIDDAKDQPLSGGDVSDVPAAEAGSLDDDIVASSESAFHLGMAIGATLMAIGGLIALATVRNPKPGEEPEQRRGPGAAAAAGECGRCPPVEVPEPQREPEPEPTVA
jgi:MFS family permease